MHIKLSTRLLNKRSVNFDDRSIVSAKQLRPFETRLIKKNRRKSPFINRVSAFNDDNYEDGTRATQIF